MASLADRLAQERREALAGLVSRSLDELAAQSHWSWATWEPVLGGVHRMSGEEFLPPLAAAACLLRDGAPALRRVGDAAVDGRIDRLGTRSDPAAHIVRAWSLAGSGDPRASRAFEAMQASGADAVVHEGHALEWEESVEDRIE